MSSSASRDRLRFVQGSSLDEQRAPRFVRLSQIRKLRRWEQVAAVCYRVRRKQIEFLLVRTRGSGRWTFPKGSAERGLTPAQAAALEAFEEAGVHGRIEEASFACYMRSRRAEDRSAGKDVSIKAYLCEVLRLSRPKESDRNRTWLCAEEAKIRLCVGRGKSEGRQFAKVVDRAVGCIQSKQKSSSRSERSSENSTDRPGERVRTTEKDGLQRVRFDFAEAYGWLDRASFIPQVRRQLNEMRQAAPVADTARRALTGQVLEFGPRLGEKKKALGTGAKNH